MAPEGELEAELAPTLATQVVRPERIWPAWVAYSVALAGMLVVGIGLFIAWAVSEVAGGARVEPEELAGRYQLFASTTVGMSVAFVGSVAVLSVVALIAAILDGGEVRKRLRLGWGRAGARHVLAMILAVLGTSSALGGILQLLQWRAESTIGSIDRAAATASPVGLTILVVLMGVAGAVEEVFFRGLMQRPLARRWGRWSGILATAAAFAAMHFDLTHGLFAFLPGPPPRLARRARRRDRGPDGRPRVQQRCRRGVGAAARLGR